MKSLKFIIMLSCFFFVGKVFSQDHSEKIDALAEQLKFKSSISLELKKESVDVLDTIANILKTTSYTYNIESHSGMIGKDSDNLIKTQKRAIIIKKALVKRGINPSRLNAVGFGETSPKTSMPNTRERSWNERIEIIKKE